MKRRYNLNTKKIYESAEQYVLNVEEFDSNGKLINNVEFEDRYPNAKVAIEDAYDIMTNVADDQNIDQDDVEFDERDNKVIFTVEGVGKWVFTATVDATNECGDNCNHDDMDECNECGDMMQESVSARFARLRKMFESDDDEDSDDNQDNETDDNGKDDTNAEDNSDDNTAEDNEDDNEDDEEMKAVILTVKKGDADKCKDELIDANIPEDDIEIIEGDEDSDNDEVRVDVNSVMELKDYLATKGIDLEEEIGGEIVSDDGEDDDETSDDNKDEEDDKGEDEEDFNFDDLGDIFGAEEEDK
jgi:hypothetical protein